MKLLWFVFFLPVSITNPLPRYIGLDKNKLLFDVVVSTPSGRVGFWYQLHSAAPILHHQMHMPRVMDDGVVTHGVHSAFMAV